MTCIGYTQSNKVSPAPKKSIDFSITTKSIQKWGLILAWWSRSLLVEMTSFTIWFILMPHLQLIFGEHQLTNTGMWVDVGWFRTFASELKNNMCSIYVTNHSQVEITWNYMNLPSVHRFNPCISLCLLLLCVSSPTITTHNRLNRRDFIVSGCALVIFCMFLMARIPEAKIMAFFCGWSERKKRLLVAIREVNQVKLLCWGNDTSEIKVRITSPFSPNLHMELSMRSWCYSYSHHPLKKRVFFPNKNQRCGDPAWRAGNPPQICLGWFPFFVGRRFHPLHSGHGCSSVEKNPSFRSPKIWSFRHGASPIYGSMMKNPMKIMGWFLGTPISSNFSTVLATFASSNPLVPLLESTISHTSFPPSQEYLRKKFDDHHYAYSELP